MAKSLKTNGRQELTAFRARIHRQVQLGRIWPDAGAEGLWYCDKLAEWIDRIDEADEGRRIDNGGTE